MGENIQNEERTHSKSFNKYYERYYFNGCTDEQLHRLAELGVIYDWEYEEITGKPF